MLLSLFYFNFVDPHQVLISSENISLF